MATPTLKRNWIFTRSGGASTLNQTIPAQTFSTNYSELAYRAQKGYFLWLLKDTLINFSSGPWQVIQSRNMSGSFGNADYWTSPSDLFSSASYAWIVLQNRFAGRDVQILISADYSDTKGCVYISTGSLFLPSVGGLEPVIPSDALRWDSQYNSASSHDCRLADWSRPYIGKCRLHVMQTWDDTEGVESLRFVLYLAGSRKVFAFWEKLENVPTGGITWDYPEVALWGPYDNYDMWWSSLSNNNALHLLHGKLPGTITQLGGRIVNQSLNGSNAIVPFLKYGISNTLINAYEITPVSVLCDLYPMYGRIGDLVDFYTSSSAIQDGMGFPVGSPEFFHIGNFAWPWDKTQIPPQLT